MALYPTVRSSTISCVHIQGTQREGADVPLRFLRPKVTARTIKRLWNLAESVDRNIRASAGASLNAPEPLLSRLAMDNDACVRIAVARNPVTPEHVLRLLSQDVDMVVRAHVALHKNTSEDTRNLLRNDVDDRVRTLVDIYEHIDD